MKGSHTNMSTTVFNFRLFLEALKRLRVIGLATAILAVTASAMVPIVTWLEYDQHSYPPYWFGTQFLCVPAVCVTILAPFFFFVLFSFLQKRKESDFFHSIPYTRTCVYVSFVTASLSFIWAIQLVCGLTAGILWGISPAVVGVDIGGMACYVLICMLASAMLCSFMMLALSVSGTAGSCMLLFILFAGFVRVLAAVFLGCMDYIDILPTTEMWENSPLSPLWFLPLTTFYYMMDFPAACEIMFSLPNILYSVVVTMAVYALAGVLYLHRKSEMAGNPAPGRKTQALFRIMFSLLPALLIPLFLFHGEDDISLHLILVVIVLLVYFLYELVTTKRPKNLLKIFPGLGIVAAVCLVFTVSFLAYRTAVLYETITKDDISTVTVESNGMGPNTYQSYLLNDFRTDDPEIRSIVAEQLALSQKAERGELSVDYYWERVKITIRTKGGRTLERNIIQSKESSVKLQDLLREQAQDRSMLYQIPSYEELDGGGLTVKVSSIHKDYIHFSKSEYNLKKILEVFREEFESLTDEQKDRVMAPTFHYWRYNDEYDDLTLSLSGQPNGQYFRSTYTITEDMPRTRARILAEWAKGTQNSYDSGNLDHHGTAAQMLAKLKADLNDEDFRKAYPSMLVSIRATPVTDMWGKGTYENVNIRISSETLMELVELLQRRNLPYGTDTLTDRTYLLYFNMNGDGVTYPVYDYEAEPETEIITEHEMSEKYDQKAYGYSELHLSTYGLYSLTAEDWQTIFDLLEIKNPMK